MKRGAGASLKLLQGRAMLLLYHFFTDRPVLLRAYYVCSGHENVLCAYIGIENDHEELIIFVLAVQS